MRAAIDRLIVFVTSCDQNNRYDVERIAKVRLLKLSWKVSNSIEEHENYDALKNFCKITLVQSLPKYQMVDVDVPSGRNSS